MNLTKFTKTAMAFAVVVALAMTTLTARAAVYSVTTADEFAAAVTAINTDGGENTISLQADIANCVGATFSTSGSVTTILGNGHKILLSNAAGFGNDMYFYVSSGAVLRLGVEGDATASALDIARAASNDTAGPIYVLETGTVHMYDGVVIHDCVGRNYFGGGVTVQGGLFHMHGGVIRDCGIDGGSVCFGGGVAAVDGGRFIMDGGTISGCFVRSDYTESSWMTPSTCGGGVLVYGSSSFIMNGGVIANCTADTGHGAGGGVALLASVDSYYNHGAMGWVDSAFVMNGGAIRDCSSAYMGGGVAVYGTYLNCYSIGYYAVVSGMNEFKTAAADATEEEKAAVAAAYAPAPGLWINSGAIEGCETANYGGGIFLMYVRPAVNTTIGEATISGCSAGEGGGVTVFNYWTQLAMSGTTVSGNTAETAAGVLLSGNNSGGTIGTTMTGVTITNNTATAAAGVGGVYYTTDSQLRLSGAVTITGNTAGSTPKDSNLYCQGHSYPFYVIGSLEGSTIGLTDPLLDDGEEDSDIYLSSGYDANNPGVHPYDRVFTSDHEGWYADYGASSETTTTTSMQETTTTADASTFKYNWYLYAYTTEHDMRYRSILYWDDANQCLTTTSSGTWSVGQIQVDGTSYIAAYTKSGSVYTIKTLKEFDPATLSLSSYPALASLGLALDSTIPSDRTDAYSGSLSNGRTQETYNITTVEEVTTTSTTPVYSAEVRLVKAPEHIAIVVRQRATDTDELITLPDSWIETLGLDHPGVTLAEVEAAEVELNTFQPNGCRLWENIVLGNVNTNFLLATVPTVTAEGLSLALPAASPVTGYGYEILYELRRADGDKVVLQRNTNHSALGIPLYPDDRGSDARDPTGLYRIWSLIVPDSNLAITNEIPTTNIVGVLKVASPLVNTITAVPWVSLASDPLAATNIAVSAAVHPANLSTEDCILAFDSAAGRYHGWASKGDGAWEPILTATVDGVTVAPAPENWRPAPGTAFWLTRQSPKDGAAAKPYFLYGQYLPGDYADTVGGGSSDAPTSTLCANPTASAVSIANLTFDGAIGADDTLVLNTDGDASVVYVRNKANTEWGRWQKTVSRGFVNSEWVQDGSIAPGTGFWYVRRASGDLTIRWPGWEE